MLQVLDKQEQKEVIKIGRLTKVLVLNSSPKKENSNTALILNPFIEGMKDKGADVEVINLYDMRIDPCTGELNCWKNTPGECSLKDDMQLLYPKIKKSYAIVIATPVYVETINSKMKNVIDRMIPLLEPYMTVSKEKTTTYNLRDGVNHAKIILISTCSNWEIVTFDETMSYIESFCMHFSYKFSGSLLRPHADIMQYFLKNKKNLDSLDYIFEAAREAGEEFIKNDRISGDLADIVNEELISREDYIKIINEQYKGELAKFDKKN